MLAKDVAAIEGALIDILEHTPGTKEDKQTYFGSLNIRVPKTSYGQMGGALKERLHSSGAASAVFACLRRHMPPRLKELLGRARRGRGVALRASEPAIIGDFFFQNGNVRRVGELFFEYLASTGTNLSSSKAPPKRSRTASRVINRPYDVALSFAGEDRSLVEEVAHLLRSQGVRIFYDAFEQADLLGKDLAAHLAEVYGSRARYCVMFISSHSYGRRGRRWSANTHRGAP